MGHYLRRDFEFPSSQEELFSALQWAEGCSGLEIRGEGNLREMSVFFAADAEPPAFDQAVWAGRGVRLLGQEKVEDADWAASYRVRAQPLRVGGFVLDPREPDGEPPDLESGETCIRLPARTAFGTGSHASTRLAIELLDFTVVRGKRVLDVGTGTGVLAFVALLRGAGKVVAFDIDPAAALVARENASLNALTAVRFFAGRLSAFGGTSRCLFDLVLVNILPHRVAEELDLLRSLVAEDARLIFSGLTAETGERVRTLLSEQEWALECSRQEEEWVGLRFRRRCSP